MKSIYNKIVLVFFFAISVIACNKENTNNSETLEYPADNISIDFSDGFYTKVVQNIMDTSFVVLHEDEETMFRDLQKLIVTENGYFVLDKTGARKVVSFQRNGLPMATYGQRGQGPGEFISPWDIDVDTTGVYILDYNGKKVLHYARNGEFINERAINFYADGFKRLANGNFIFNIAPAGEGEDRFCVTDSTMTPISSFCPYPENYLGGLVTKNIFRTIGNGFLLNRIPTDTIIEFDNNGNILGYKVLDFNQKNIDEIAKYDYLSFDGKGKDYLRLMDSPIPVNDSLWIALATSAKERYIIAINTKDGSNGTMNVSNSPSVYDILWPLSSMNGEIITLLDEGLIKKCNDVDNLPDSIQTSMEAGLRVLMHLKVK